MTSSELAFGSTQIPMNGALAVELNVLLVVFRTEYHVSDVAETDDDATLP